MLRSPDYSCKCCAQFKFAPTVCDFFWNSPCLGGKGVSNRIWDPCEMLAENDIVMGTSCIIFKMNFNFLRIILNGLIHKILTIILYNSKQISILFPACQKCQIWSLLWHNRKVLTIMKLRNLTNWNRIIIIWKNMFCPVWHRSSNKCCKLSQSALFVLDKLVSCFVSLVVDIDSNFTV